MFKINKRVLEIMLKKGLFLLTFFILILPFISSVCEEEQIDINTASLEELDTLQGIGPAYAQRIVNARPFKSVNDLIDVSGIGNVTLEKIKTQGLACVDDENEDNEEIVGQSIDTNKTEIIEEDTYSAPVQPKVIELNSLNSKDINTEKSNEKLSAERYAISGFVAFSILIVFLLFINRRKKQLV